MPKVPDPLPPLDRSPTLRDGTVSLADGTPVRQPQLSAIARWTSLKLSVYVERYPFEWAQDRAPRVPAVRALVALLAEVATWTHLYSSLGGHGVPPARHFTKKAFTDAVAKVALQRFNANRPAPIVLVRTGALTDLQYEASLAVTDLMVHLFAHDTPAHRKTFDRLFKEVRRAHDATVSASLGHGYAGSLSSAAVGIGIGSGLAPQFYAHDEAQLTPPWLMHLGALCLPVPDAAKRMETFAKNHAEATMDADGLLMSLPPAQKATDRSASRIAAWRSFSSFVRVVVRKSMNTAFHDRKQRRMLLAATGR